MGPTKYSSFLPRTSRFCAVGHHIGIAARRSSLPRADATQQFGSLVRRLVQRSKILKLHTKTSRRELGGHISSSPTAAVFRQPDGPLRLYSVYMKVQQCTAIYTYTPPVVLAVLFKSYTT